MGGIIQESWQDLWNFHNTLKVITNLFINYIHRFICILWYFKEFMEYFHNHI